MDLVRSRLEGCIHRRAPPAELRLHGIFFDAEFSDRVRRRVDCNRAVAYAVVINPIQKKVVIKRPQTVDC